MNIHDFDQKEIGKGIWHSWHIVSHKAKLKPSKEGIETVRRKYLDIIDYCNVMLCGVCNNHSIQYLSSTSYIQKILYSKELTSEEIIEEFCLWLYGFQESANINAGKGKGPSYSMVKEFYIDVKMCKEGCGH